MNLALAAYGTLLPGCGGAEYLGIEDKLEDLGPCTLKGRLWLVQKQGTKTEEIRLVPAFYPEEGVVQAHLFRVPEEVWSVIDDFAGFVPHDRNSAYIREESETLEGESVWLYRGHNVEPINYLRDGDWRRYAYHPKAIPLFSCSETFPEKTEPLSEKT
jgi:gamma-glutamylcyclotransferase (GGCT)/AIG2-like uncharacterized protein YtfP